MSNTPSLFGAASPKDLRMTLDRLLSPQNAHPLAVDLFESLRENRFGEAQLALASLRRRLDLDAQSLSKEFGCLLFANAAHSPDPFAAFDFLIDSGFDPAECATDIMEHLALGRYREPREMGPILGWFLDRGGLIQPRSKAAWKALRAHYPETFAANHGRHEARELDACIQSNALELREANRL